LKKARVVKLIGGLYSFKDLKTKEVFEGYARGKLRKIRVEKDSSFNKNVTMSTKKDVKDIVLSPKVGDIVHYEFESDQYMITEVLPRQNELIRPDIANIDQVLLVFSAVSPDFSFNLLDKFLVILGYNVLKPIILVTKIDLIDEESLIKLKESLNYYKPFYDIYYVNSKARVGIDTLDDIFEGKITILAGQTGAGKSTFLNALRPELALKTQEISESLGRGKHTTRHSELFEYGGGYICDTPGFSKVDFEFHDATMIKNYFLDFKKYSDDCKFGYSCQHISEPDCMVKSKVASGDILKSRYESYLNFVDILKTRKEKF